MSPVHTSCSVPTRPICRRPLLHALLAVCALFCAMQPLQARQPSLTISKTASVDTVQSGVYFTWTINYSVASTNSDANNVVITDVLPPQVMHAAANVQLIGNAQTASTSYNPVTGTATFTMINPLPAGSSGQVQISCMFPPGITPNGTVTCNTATISASNATSVTSNNSCVVALAVHRFSFVKEHYAGNALNGTVVYRLRVTNPTNNSIGGLNLTNAYIRDTIPAGSVFVSATGSYTVTGNVVSWFLDTLFVSPYYNPYYIDRFLTVQYPSPPFTQGQTVCNKGWLTGVPVASSPFAQADTACVVLVAAQPGGTLLKGPSYSPMTNRVPGCAGYYTLSPSNSGNVAIDSFKVTDTPPATIKITSFSTGSYVNFPSNSVTIRYRTTVNAAWTTMGPYIGNVYVYVYGAPSSTNMGLSPGQYVTQLQWDYGTVPVGFSTNYPAIINFDLLANNYLTSAPVLPGDTITNCATLTWRYGSVPATPVQSCKSFVVDSPKPLLSPQKLQVSTGPYFPGDTIRFLLRVYNIGAAGLNTPVITDVLPAGLQYLNTVSYAGGGGGPSPATLSPAISVLGSTVKWTFGAPFPAAACGTGGTYWYDIVFDVLVTNGTPPGTVCNSFSVGGSNHPTVSSNSVCVVINSVPTMESQKLVRGSLDSTYQLGGTTVGGGSADYQLTVTNTGNVTLKDIKIVDILPFPGDVGVINWSVTRGSTWQANLIGPITAPAGTNVFYSIETNPCRSDLTLAGPGGCTGPTWYTWGGLLGASYNATNVRSVKLDFGPQLLAPGQTFTVTWPMTAPVGVPPGQPACNSFGYIAKRADNNAPVGPAEPLKVCITIKDGGLASVGNFVWNDTNMNGVQDAGEPGINGVQVELWRLGPDNTPYTADDTIAVNNLGVPIPFVMTANNFLSQPGYYLFTNLPAGKYYVRFQVPAGYVVSPLNVGAATTDNDANPVGGPTYGWTAPFNLAASTSDTTIDMGIYFREKTDCSNFRGVVKPNGQAGCCFTLQFPMPFPSKTLTVKPLAPTTVTSLTPPSGWTATPQGGVYPTGGVLVSAPGPVSGVQSLNFCLSPGSVQPQTIVLTWRDSSGLVLCRDTVQTDCKKDSAGTGPTGVKFHDLNGNGTHDPTEPGIDGWLIALVPVDGDGKPIETRTGKDGAYSFGTVPSGTYYLIEEHRSGWVQTAPESGAYLVSIAPGGTTPPPYDFGNTQPPCEAATDTIRMIAGTVDQFTGPEPSSPSPALLAWNTANYGLPLVGFDGATKDQGAFFGHTFTGFGKPGCWLMGAKLKIRMRATGWSSANDGIGIVSGSTLAWYHSIAPMSVMSTWNPGQIETFTLDLDSLLPGQFMGTTSVLAAMATGTLNVFVQNHTDVDWIGLEVYICCPDEHGTAVLQGCKFNDLNGNGIWDTGSEPAIPGWTIHLSNGMTVTTGQNGCYSITVPAPATYTISEATALGWVQTFPASGTHTVTVQPGQTLTGLNFGNIKKDSTTTGTVISCDSLSGASVDSACCQYNATILNNMATPVTSISWSITGGTLSSLTTAPCAPVTPPTTGTTSGVLTYAPACAGNVALALSATPTTASGWVSVTLVVHHGEKDSCVLTFRYRCERAPVTRCDSVKVKPFLFTGLDLSGRTFTVFNVKVPASPIISIDIIGTPVPCFLQGGALSVDGTGTPWSVPYTRIPITGLINANTQVKFNLGVDYTCGWTGSITLVVHHADGDSCRYTYGPWSATPPTTTGGVVVSTTPVSRRLFASSLRVENTSGKKPVKWVSVEVLNKEDRVFAGSGARWDGTTGEAGEESLDEHQQGRTEALFGLTVPVAPGKTSAALNLVIARDSLRSGMPSIRWTTYDEDGNAMTTDTLVINVTVLSVRNDAPPSSARGFELLSSFPNPASNTATVNYMVASDMDVRLELFDESGRFVTVIDAGWRYQGVHAVRLDFGALPAGTYYLRMTAQGGSITKPLVLTR